MKNMPELFGIACFLGSGKRDHGGWVVAFPNVIISRIDSVRLVHEEGSRIVGWIGCIAMPRLALDFAHSRHTHHEKGLKMKELTITLFLIPLFGSFLFCQSIKRIVLNEKDYISGYYLAVEPQGDSIAGVLVLLSGFGQNAESIFPETKLHNVAYVNNILTIAFAEGNKLSADSIAQTKLTAVLRDVIKKYNVNPE